MVQHVTKLCFLVVFLDQKACSNDFILLGNIFSLLLSARIMRTPFVQGSTVVASSWCVDVFSQN